MSSSPGWLATRIRPNLAARSSEKSQVVDEEVHSCSFCQFLVQSPEQGGSFSVPITISKKDAERGLKHGCRFIRWCVAEAAEVDKRPPMQFEAQFTTKPDSPFDIVEVEFRFHAQFGPSMTVCAEADNAAAKFISTRPINADPSTDASFALASHWIETCHAEHPDCSIVNEESFTPLMLIDVGVKDKREPRLYHPKAGQKLRWCCLSYCWGGDQTLRTTKATREIFTHVMSWKLLPPTICDAIKTTRVLGIPYLWVDAFCITQDDSEEMASLMAVMSKIYKNAYVTIIASSASKSNDGFLQKRNLNPADRPMFALPYKNPDGILGSLSFFMDDGYDPRLEPCRQRCWTLQERLLSIRMLDYGMRHLRWACRTTRHGDGGFRNPIPSGAEGTERLKPQFYVKAIKNPKNKDGWDVLNTWPDIVTDYTSRYLSVANDKLPAIGGVAREYIETLNAEYFAGFLKEMLPVALLWYVDNGTQRMRPSSYRAPTFSWASVDSPVQCKPPDLWWDSRKTAVLLETSVTPKNPANPFGELVGGYIKTRVLVLEDECKTTVSKTPGLCALTKLDVLASLDVVGREYLEILQGKTLNVYVIGFAGEARMMDNVLKSRFGCILATTKNGVTFERIGAISPICPWTDAEFVWREIVLK